MNDSNTVITSASEQGTTGKLSITIPTGATKLRFSIAVPANTGELYGYMMICLKSIYDSDPSYQPYAKSNYELTQDVEPIPRLIDAGSKNLVKLRQAPSSANTQISGSISNGVVVLSTSAAVSANSPVLITDGVFVLEAGKKYMISGCPGTGNVRIFLRNSRGEFVTGQFGDAIEYIPQTSGNYDLIVFLYSGTSLSNFEIKPMLCTTEDYKISPEFVPHAKSNYELTQAVEPIPSLVDRGAKNIFDIAHAKIYGKSKILMPKITIRLTSGFARIMIPEQ
jgi:hypothetical protein